jgi:hypothetical protein
MTAMPASNKDDSPVAARERPPRNGAKKADGANAAATERIVAGIAKQVLKHVKLRFVLLKAGLSSRSSVARLGVPVHAAG